MRTVKLLAEEGDLTAASNVDAASVVRAHNTTAGALLMTQKNSGGATLASMTLTAGEVVYVEKATTDTLEGGVGIKAVSVAYR